MPTPQNVFAEIASRYGQVNLADEEAITNFYRDILPGLPVDQIAAIQQELLDGEGVPSGTPTKREYLTDVSLPKLDESSEQGEHIIEFPKPAHAVPKNKSDDSRASDRIV